MNDNDLTCQTTLTHFNVIASILLFLYKLIKTTFSGKHDEINKYMYMNECLAVIVHPMNTKYIRNKSIQLRLLSVQK